LLIFKPQKFKVIQTFFLLEQSLKYLPIFATQFTNNLIWTYGRRQVENLTFFKA
jgi:hypothetical protein